MPLNFTRCAWTTILMRTTKAGTVHTHPSYTRARIRHTHTHTHAHTHKHPSRLRLQGPEVTLIPRSDGPQHSTVTGPLQRMGCPSFTKGLWGPFKPTQPQSRRSQSNRNLDLMAVQGWGSRCSGDPSISFYSSVSLLKEHIIMDPELS